MPAQLILPFEAPSATGREDFLVGSANGDAVAFIDRWPEWPVAAAALHGPAGSGKTHLVQIWQAHADARVILAAALNHDLLAALGTNTPLAIEDVDRAPPTADRDHVLITLLEQTSRPLLLTGRTSPGEWPVALPDLASRFRALPSFALWQPDDALLAGIVRKLFTDRQLDVPDTVVMRIVQSLERSPAAVRAFVARADAEALARHRPVTPALIGELLAAETGLS